MFALVDKMKKIGRKLLPTGRNPFNERFVSNDLLGPIEINYNLHNNCENSLCTFSDCRLRRAFL